MADTVVAYKVQCIVTGVAGAPYYITGYFDKLVHDAESAQAAWVSLLAPSGGGIPTGATFTFDGSIETVGPDGTIVSVDNIASVTVTGSKTSDRAPAECQILFRWKTGVYPSGRQVQGRTNWPFVYTADLDPAGNLKSTTITAWNSTINSFLGAGGFVVRSAKNDKFYDVDAYSVWNKTAVLRSRRD
uniref:Uncharacterized protein n=1 Tax=uncultured prokaryote TaxID=198431 RepID=A0A0H5Q7U8_9ZZZZ|nr:hypothetical protein [uncultured prokaryote]